MSCSQHPNAECTSYLVQGNVCILLCARCARSAVIAVGIDEVHIKPLPRLRDG